MTLDFTTLDFISKFINNMTCDTIHVVYKQHSWFSSWFFIRSITFSTRFFIKLYIKSFTFSIKSFIRLFIKSFIKLFIKFSTKFFIKSFNKFFIRFHTKSFIKFFIKFHIFLWFTLIEWHNIKVFNVNFFFTIVIRHINRTFFDSCDFNRSYKWNEVQYHCSKSQF